ncbi:uncharacterized protein LOC134819632 [Bolinopsis microptera]|uniref:uncharacterized protein LOC134819632 n=1 Tax=Bolinopsis microptera TaxID=2820187 RepID=UPI0030795D44
MKSVIFVALVLLYTVNAGKVVKRDNHEDEADSEDAYSCVQGPDGKVESSDCEAGDKCSSPTFVDYQGYNSEVEWGCGCADGVDDCDECENEDGASGCNADKSQKFECYNHSWNAESAAWEAVAEATSCHVSAETDVKCNSPAPLALEDEWESFQSGCGPCANDENEKCVSCEGDGCNSAAALAAFFLPLMAALYALM